MWWRDGTPHQTTIESTESKRCGLLRTGANRIEKPAGTAIGHGRSSRFFALIGRRYAASTSFAFWGQFNSRFGNRTRVRRPSQKHTHLHIFESGVPGGNATALTRQCDCITIQASTQIRRRLPWPRPSKSNPHSPIATRPRCRKPCVVPSSWASATRSTTPFAPAARWC